MCQHIYEKVYITHIEHIENGWIVTDDGERKVYYNYERLNKALAAIGNGGFQQCGLCGEILEF